MIHDIIRITTSITVGLAAGAISHYLLGNTKTGKKVLKEVEKVADNIETVSKPKSVNKKKVEDEKKNKPIVEENLAVKEPDKKDTTIDRVEGGGNAGSNPDPQLTQD